MKRPASQPKSVKVWLPAAVVSGLLVGLAYPPFDASWLIWVGLVPFLWAIRHETRTTRAFLMGFVAGTVVYLMTIRPLVSAHLWSGWEAVPVAELEGRQTTQLVVLNLLWPLLSVWGGLFWGAFSLGLSKLARGSLDRMAVLAPALLLLFTEWLRSSISWGFHWAFLGNAAIKVTGVLQLGALGGVWLLTWLVVLVNVGVLALLSRKNRPRRWMLPAGVACVLALVMVVGAWRAEAVMSRLSARDGFPAAALQYHQPRYSFGDYTPLGLEKAYLELMRQVARGDAGEVRLLVLPESITFGILSLDGSRSSGKPELAYQTPEAWMETLSWVIGHSDGPFAIVLGLNTVEQGALHNSLAFWTRSGLQNWYHKQRLVPFAEYQPAVLGLFGLRGQSSYEPGGESRVGELLGIRIGGFICQEVLTPAVLRRSTLQGAQILVSGGNDGVFASPAVAEVHAGLARLRAVETGRYVIRAMKTGISAIIAPNGEEVGRSPSAEPFVVVERVGPVDELTPYVRFGDWPVSLAVVVVGAGIVMRLRKNGQLARKPSRRPRESKRSARAKQIGPT